MNAFADQLHEVERGIRADTNRLRGVAESLKQLGDDALAGTLDQIATRSRERAETLRRLRESDAEETTPGLLPNPLPHRPPEDPDGRS